MKPRCRRRHCPIASLLSAAAMLATLPAAMGQNRGTPQVTLSGGFRVPITEGNRTVALVSGKEARPALLAGKLNVTEFRLETFRYDPNRASELIVESPVGVFDSKGASSVEPISLHSADDRFAVGGRGWAWEKATGLLVISNEIRTVLRRPGPGGDHPSVTVTSRRLEYNVRTGATRFVGECVAEEPGRARLRAGELASVLGVQAQRPDVIHATNGVEIELTRPGHEGSATGSAAEYTVSAEGERIRLFGPATWDFGPGTGAADALDLLPAQQSYSARGSARMELRSSLGPRNAGSSERPPLVITASAIEARPGEVTFEGPVAARQSDTLELHATRVVALLNPEVNPTQADAGVYRITAAGNAFARVLAGAVPVELHGEQMVYSKGEHPMIEVQGQPSWKTPNYRGRAERFFIHPDDPAFEAIGSVDVVWEAARPAGSGGDSAIELQSQHMRVDSGRAEFTGGVAAHQTAWDLHAGEVDFEISSNAAPRQIHALREVELEYRAPLFGLSTNRGPAAIFASLGADATAPVRKWTLHTGDLRVGVAGDRLQIADLEAIGGVKVEHLSLEAEGGRATYHANEGRLRLTDSARLRTLDGLEVIGDTETALGIDLKSGRFFVEGPVKKMRFPAAAVRDHKTLRTMPVSTPE